MLDGDTLDVLHDHHAERIRLSGIDCPKKSQAYGQRAEQAQRKVYGKEITLRLYRPSPLQNTGEQCSRCDEALTPILPLGLSYHYFTWRIGQVFSFL